MQKLKRQRVERTEDWGQLRLLAKWPEQARSKATGQCAGDAGVD
jgi:hypothetical protein